MTESWGAAVFDRLYSANDDPWQFQTSAYEHEKYAATLAALPSASFSAALEAGCSIGVLTRGLAGHCKRLLAVDASEAALKLARARCHDLSHVSFARMTLPHDWPLDDQYELIVFSEILYFLDQPDLRLTAAHCSASLLPGGVVVLVNWTGTTDTPTTGDAAAELFIKESGLCPIRQTRAQSYRLDLLRKLP